MSDTFKKPILFGKVGKIPKTLSKPLPPKSDPPPEPVEIPSPEEPIEKIEPISQSEETKNVEPNSENKINEPQVNYKEPSWSGQPESGKNFGLEVLKSGVIIDTIELSDQNYWIFGRLPQCDLFLQHPTISRFHAVLQYNAIEAENRSIGFYIYDLGSTHGTFLNKNRIKSRMFVKIHVGHMLKFGNSTRSYIFKGPEEDSEPESELTVTEIKQNRIMEQKKREAEIEERKALEEQNRIKELEQGIDWGMGEDADEESDLTENPYAITTNEELYLDDPKKTLRGFFEREGEELNYEVEERGIGQFICRVELPLENTNGRPLIAEAIVKGKKKEAVVQCALEACRILDRAGVLRQAKHESRKRKPKNWEEDDYCNSDDDEFFDRTGAVERKKQYRMKQQGAVKETAETYESLVAKEKVIAKHIQDNQIELDNAKLRLQELEDKDKTDVDSLDDFMSTLKDDVPTKQTISRITLQLVKLRQEQASLVKLINIAKPVHIPTYAPQQTVNKGTSSKMPIIGKRIKLKPIVAKETVLHSEKVEEKTEDNEEENETERVKQNVVANEKVMNEPVKDVKNVESEVKTENVVEEAKVIGPAKPEFLSSSEFKAVSSHKSRNRIRKRNEEQFKKYENDDKYSTWLPPENQKGDGKTALNEKLGY